MKGKLLDDGQSGTTGFQSHKESFAQRVERVHYVFRVGGAISFPLTRVSFGKVSRTLPLSLNTISPTIFIDPAPNQSHLRKKKCFPENPLAPFSRNTIVRTVTRSWYAL